MDSEDDDDEFPITHLPDLSPFNSDEEDILEFSTVNELMTEKLLSLLFEHDHMSNILLGRRLIILIVIF